MKLLFHVISSLTAFGGSQFFPYQELESIFFIYVYLAELFPGSPLSSTDVIYSHTGTLLIIALS